MSNYDSLFDTLFRRAIGYDHLQPYARPRQSFPPYNINKLDGGVTEIEVALAGYTIDDIDLVRENNTLRISSSPKSDDSDVQYQYRGIAKRSFNLSFALGNDIEIQGAAMVNGMLVVRLKLEEAALPQSIPIMSELPLLELNDDSDSADPPKLQEAV